MTEPEPPTFQPLKPARTKAPLNNATVRGTKSNLKMTVNVQNKGDGRLEPGLFSSRTFRSKLSSGSMTIDELSAVLVLSPVFRHMQDLERGSLCPPDSRRKHTSSDVESFTAPIAGDVRKALGQSGALGGSDVSAYGENQLDASDPYSN
jgi:hypothetical protein